MNLASVPIAALRDFADLVLRMRSAQRAYFLSRELVLLEKSKHLERLVDSSLNHFLAATPVLFDPEAAGDDAG